MIMSPDVVQNIFPVTSVIFGLHNEANCPENILRRLYCFVFNYAYGISRVTFSPNNTQTVVCVTSFLIAVYQVSKYFVLAPQSVMI